jgi:hypothetical protein
MRQIILTVSLSAFSIILAGFMFGWAFAVVIR